MTKVWAKKTGIVQVCSLGRHVAIIWLAVALAFPAYSAQDFFQATIAVSSQSPSVRKVAAKKAFAEVMVRLSGTELVLENPQIHAAMGKAINYVEQFQYHPQADPSLVAEGLKEEISLTFSPTTIERLLRKNDQPFWPVNRPSTLIWLVEDSVDYGKQFVSSELAPEVFVGIEAAAHRRGLPLSYPLLDLQDQTNLSAEQLWQLDEEAILTASSRYSADVILVGRYSATSRGELLATWQLFHRGETRVYDSRNEALDLLGAMALDPLADYLGRRYALMPRDESADALVLQLNGVDTFARYRKALSYLEGIAAISGVELAGVRQDTLLLYLDSDADVDKFKSALAIDSRLSAEESIMMAGELPVWQQLPQGTLENPLRYRWVR